ncbi:MAG: hypothetical protein QOG67_3024 [Verrucomicrobiota bacterium]|jgi:hypothetical protein
MEKTDKQPDGPGGVGKEKDDAAGAEVAGRSKLLLWTCFNDGAGNYISPDWEWFSCWKCGTLYNLKTGDVTARTWP